MVFDRCKTPGTPLISRVGLIKVRFRGHFLIERQKALFKPSLDNTLDPSLQYLARNFAICANGSILRNSGEMLAKSRLAKYLGFATNTMGRSAPCDQKMTCTSYAHFYLIPEADQHTIREVRKIDDACRTSEGGKYLVAVHLSHLCVGGRLSNNERRMIFLNAAGLRIYCPRNPQHKFINSPISAQVYHFLRDRGIHF
jgi:hypothetical protein